MSTGKGKRLQKGYESDLVTGKILERVDWGKSLSQTGKPVLLLNGKYDPVASVKMTKRIASKAKNVKFIVFKKSSHDIFADEPLEFSRTVNGFLAH